MTTTSYFLPPSSTRQVQVVQPRVWPGVQRAASVTPPSFTSSPSFRMRSTGHGFHRLVVYRYWPLPPEAMTCIVAAHDVDLGAGDFLQECMAGDVVRVGMACQ